MRKSSAKSSVGIISLGCPRNLADSERILSRLKKKGHKVVDIKDADVAIVNTCSFIKEAKEESIDTIFDVIDLKKQGVVKKIIVAGCLPQRYKSELLPHLKEIDAFVGRQGLDKYSAEKHSLVPKHFSYLKISEGCRNHCSYCIIPKIKGPLQSRPVKEIIKEVRLSELEGVKELNIVGQDITSYGSDISSSLGIVELLEEIIKNSKKIRWIRLLYTHPLRVDDGLIELIKREKRICKYIDLPIQHINDRILKAMNRKISKKEISTLIDKIRKEIPSVAIRTSLIVGFPSETEKEFKELLAFIKQTKFERLGVFIYSREEGTPAYNFKGQVPEKVKKERFDKIMALQQDIAAEVNRKYLGKDIEVIIDEKGEDKDIYLGRSESDAPEVDGLVYVRSKSHLKNGDIVKVKIVDTYEYDLVGEKK